MSPGDLRGLPIPPRIRTFKVGINHFDRILIGGALKLSKRENSGISRMGQVEGPILRKGKHPRIWMTQENRVDP